MGIRKKCIAADLRLTQQSLPFISVWVCNVANAFIQCGELVLQYAKKATIIQPVFMSLFPLSERQHPHSQRINIIISITAGPPGPSGDHGCMCLELWKHAL